MARRGRGTGTPDMSSLSALLAFARNSLADWRSFQLDDLQFWHRSEARLTLVALVGLSAILLLVRLAIRRRPGRHRVVLPAVLDALPKSRGAFLIHVPLLLLLAGVPFFVLALADPFTALVSREVSYPGRRISILIDASTSMRTPFRAAKLNTRSPVDATFFTTVAAAERFVQLRIQGKYRDLLALVEFGNEAYVITPFTNDYDNILLSISLIGDPVEFSMFPDQGTVIARGIEESVALFKAFNFLDASGNLLVIFTDGEDTHVVVHGRSLDDILQAAIDAKVPVYLVRVNYDRAKGKVIPDDIWIPAVEKTGGQFFAASDEDTLLAAIAEIDRVSAGTISVRQYSSQRPQFGPFALVAAMFWTAAIASKLMVPQFQKFP
jgi:Ca-activated chloride channel family protein